MDYEYTLIAFVYKSRNRKIDLYKSILTGCALPSTEICFVPKSSLSKQ